MNLRGPKVTLIHPSSVWQACGKSSTKFPHGELVERLPTPRKCPWNFHKVFEISNFHENQYFLGISFLRNFPVGWDSMDLAVALPCLYFETCIWIFNIFWTRNALCLSIDKNMVNSTRKCISLSFWAGPSLSGLAAVSVLLFGKKKYFHSTSHYSSSRKISALRVIITLHWEYSCSTSYGWVSAHMAIVR